MPTIEGTFRSLIEMLNNAKNRAGKSEQGRLLSISLTDVEKALWAFEKSEKKGI